LGAPAALKGEATTVATRKPIIALPFTRSVSTLLGGGGLAGGVYAVLEKTPHSSKFTITTVLAGSVLGHGLDVS